MEMKPASALSIPPMMFSRVDLPEPEGQQDADLAAHDRKRHPTQDLLPGLTAAVALFQVHDLQKFVFFCHDILFLCKRAGMRREAACCHVVFR